MIPFPDAEPPPDLGRFFDGIMLHQILQWHHPFSAYYPPTTLGNLELNILGDGFFHAATYLSTAGRGRV